MVNLAPCVPATPLTSPARPWPVFRRMMLDRKVAAALRERVKQHVAIVLLHDFAMYCQMPPAHRCQSHKRSAHADGSPIFLNDAPQRVLHLHAMPYGGPSSLAGTSEHVCV